MPYRNLMGTVGILERSQEACYSCRSGRGLSLGAGQGRRVSYTDFVSFWLGVRVSLNASKAAMTHASVSVTT